MKSKYDLREQYNKMPKEVKETFRDTVLEEVDITYNTFYNWLSQGIPSKSKQLKYVLSIVNRFKKGVVVQ